MNIQSDIIFAVLALIFAGLNIVLWVILWKSSNFNSKKLKNPERKIEFIDRKLDQIIQKNSRFEDQLWGIMDRIKEIEKEAQQFKEYKEIIYSVEEWNKKTAQALKEFYQRTGKDLTGSKEKLDRLNQAFESLDGNIAEFRKEMRNIER